MTTDLIRWSSLRRLTRYVYNVAACSSQLLNAVLAGNRRQTLSARTYEAAVIARRWWWWPLLVAFDAPFWIAKRVLIWRGYTRAAGWTDWHCRDAYEGYDRERTYGETLEGF